MKLFIPPLGTQIRLTKDWEFKLFDESRNHALMKPRMDEFKSLKYGLEYKAQKFWEDNFHKMYGPGHEYKSWSSYVDESRKIGRQYWFHISEGAVVRDPNSQKITVHLAIDKDLINEYIKLLQESHHPFLKYSLEKGTVLRVDRIYIRKGAPTFDSISFYISKSPDLSLMPKKAGGTRSGAARFWVELQDANQIECELEKTNT